MPPSTRSSENQQPGTRPRRGTSTVRVTQHCGFSTDISVNAGLSVGFKIKTNAQYSIDIYRPATTAATVRRSSRPAFPRRAVTQPTRLTTPRPAWHAVTGPCPPHGLSVCRLRCVHRQRPRPTAPALKPHHLRRTRMPAPLTSSISLRHHVAGLQPLRRLELLHRLDCRHVRLEVACPQDQLQPPIRYSR